MRFLFGVAVGVVIARSSLSSVLFRMETLNRLAEYNNNLKAGVDSLIDNQRARIAERSTK
jgi:hypothetical protein